MINNYSWRSVRNWTQSIKERARQVVFYFQLSGATYMEVHEQGGGINFTVEHVQRATEESLYQIFLEVGGFFDHFMLYAILFIKVLSKSYNYWFLKLLDVVLGAQFSLKRQR